MTRLRAVGLIRWQCLPRFYCSSCCKHSVCQEHGFVLWDYAFRVCSCQALEPAVCVTNASRLWWYVLSKSRNIPFTSLNPSSDAEIGCGIVCGCLPLLPAFFRHLTRKSSKAKSHVNTHNREKAHASSNLTTDKRVVAWGDPSKSKAFAGGGYVEMDDLEADRWPRDA